MLPATTSSQCVLSADPLPNPLPTQAAFDAAYEASLNTQQLSLLKLGQAADPTTTIVAQALATSGVVVDVPVMVWAWDPYFTMLLRAQEGYAWVPSALQPPVQAAPGINFPGAAPYNASAPPNGAIPVSLNLTDYPAFAAPQPAPAPPTDPIGPLSNAALNLYDQAPGVTYSGAMYTATEATAVHPAGNYQKIQQQTMIGIPITYWKLLAPGAS